MLFKPKNFYLYALVAFIAAGFFLRVQCLDCYNFAFGGDESDYARVAKGITNGCMIISHYYMTAGFMYIEAVSFLVLGASEFSARLVSVVLGMLSAVVLFFLVRMIYGERKALVSAVLFIFTPFVLFENRVANTDSALLFFILLSIYFALLFLKERKSWQFYALWIAVGFGMNVKPAMYIMLPVFMVFAWMHRGVLANEITKKRVFIALCLILLFFIPSFVMNIGSLMLGRQAFLLSYGSSTNFVPFRSMPFYLSGLADAMSVPVSLFFAVALAFVMYKKRDRHVIFLCSMAIIFVMFFGSAEKAYLRYLLPVVPVLCVAGALFVDELKKYGYIVLGLFVIAGSLYYMNTVYDDGYFYSSSYASLRERTGWQELSAFLVNNTNESDVIIGSQPMIEFYAGRKGLNIDENILKKPPVDAKYIVKEEGHMDEFGEYIDQHLPLLMETGRFKIYSINSTERSETVKILPLCVNYYLDRFILNRTIS